MEDEEDDLYGSAAPEDAPANGNVPIKAEQMDVSEDSDEDSDDVRALHRIYSTGINSNTLDRTGHPNHN
jgi:hypothetical protein